MISELIKALAKPYSLKIPNITIDSDTRVSFTTDMSILDLKSLLEGVPAWDFTVDSMDEMLKVEMKPIGFTKFLEEIALIKERLAVLEGKK